MRIFNLRNENICIKYLHIYIYIHVYVFNIYPNIKSDLLIFNKQSLIEIRLQKSNIMLCVDNKIGCVYIIAFKHPLK